MHARDCAAAGHCLQVGRHAGTRRSHRSRVSIAAHALRNGFAGPQDNGLPSLALETKVSSTSLRRMSPSVNRA